MKSYLKLILPTLAIILLSCDGGQSSSTNGDVTTLPWKIDTTRSIKDIVATTEVVPLETHLDGLFAHMGTMKVDQAGYYVLDFRSNVMIGFNHDGTFRCRYGRIGRAFNSGEYLEVAAFCVDSSKLYTLDNYQKRMFVFDKLTGKISETKEMPFYVFDLETLDNGGFVFVWKKHAQTKLDGSERRITITDANINVEQTMFKPKASDGVLGKNSYLTNFEDKISYQHMFSDTVHIFDRKNSGNYTSYLLPIDNPIPENEQLDKDIYDEKNPWDTHNFLGSNGSAIIVGKYLFGTIQGVDKYGVFAYDLDQEAYIFNDKTDRYNFMFDNLSYHNGCLYVCVDRWSYDKAVEAGFKPSNRVDVGDSEFLVVKYTLK